MINLTFRTVDDSGPLPSMAGVVLDGAPSTQPGLLKNTGDETITALRLWVENDPAYPLTCTATVNGVTVPDVQGVPEGQVPENPAVLTAGSGLPAGGLPPGGTLGLSLTWSGTAGVAFTGLDSCRIRWGAQ